MAQKRLEYFPFKSEKYLSSLDVQGFSREEEHAYFRLIIFSWISRNPPYLKFDPRALANSCKCRDEADFIQIWETIKGNFKFKPGRNKNGDRWFYHPVVMETYTKVLSLSVRGRKGGLKSAQKRKLKKVDKSAIRNQGVSAVLFSQSAYFDIEKFKEVVFKQDRFKVINVEHYYHKIDKWSRTKNKKRSAESWPETIMSFLTTDEQDNKLVLVRNTDQKKPDHKNGYKKPGAVVKNTSDLKRSIDEINQKYK